MIDELPTDILIRIACILEFKDIVALQCLCKRLYIELERDELWKHHIQQWILHQDHRSGILATSPSKVKQAFRLSSYSGLFRALHLLGYWPAGVYSCSNPPYNTSGILLKIDHNKECFHLSFVKPQPATNSSLPTYTQRPICIVIVVAIPNHSSVLLPDKECISIKFQWVLQGIKNISIVREAIAIEWGTPTATGLLHHLAGLGRVSMIPQGSHIDTLHRPHHPLDNQLPSWYPKSLLPLGIFTGHYGGHGFEVLQIGPPARNEPSQSDMTHGIGGPRLEGLKLTGDPNVPASKLSFVVDVSQFNRGPYEPANNRVQDQADLDRLHRNTHTLVYGPHGMHFVDLTARGVVAVFHRAKGQINRIPGQWHPEWVDCDLLVYEGADSFSIVFEEIGFDIGRHAIDFHPFPDPDYFLDKSSE